MSRAQWIAVSVGLSVAVLIAVPVGASSVLSTKSPAPSVSNGGEESEAPQIRASASRPKIVKDYIPYGPKRKRQMAAYSFRHYGKSSANFSEPKQIVLHYTVTSTYRSTWHLFASNQPSPGNAGTAKELPGGCTHFVIGKSGNIYQLAPLDVMCRHVVGLNDTAVGIEFVEETSASNILHRKAQVRSGLALVRWLQATYGIGTTDVIGHAMANQSRYFTDLEGWYNDHDDWPTSHVKVFRSRL